MGKHRPASLSLFDLVRLRDQEFVKLGLDPYDRLRLAGHERAIGEVWLTSIGLWGDVESAEVIRNDAPWEGVLPVTSVAFRQYKARRRLMTRRQFQLRHGPQPWRRAELSFEVHLRAQRVLRDVNGFYPCIGVACAYGTRALDRYRGQKSLGLLTVEVVVGVQLFADVLAHHGVDYDGWTELEDDVKKLLWQRSRDEGICEVARYLHRPAIRHLEGFDDFPEGSQQSA